MTAAENAIETSPADEDFDAELRALARRADAIRAGLPHPTSEPAPLVETSSAAAAATQAPVRALLGGVVPVEVIDALDGPSRCRTGCGVEVASVGADCLGCTAKRAQAEHAQAVERAWMTVPRTLRWVRLEGAAAAERGGPPLRIEDWVRDRAALARTRELAKRLDDLRRVSFVGPAGAGKTTLMVALLREFVRRGWSHKAPAAMRARARRARFVSVPSLVAARAEASKGDPTPPIVHQAFDAVVLALDEVGRRDATGVTFRVVHERHAEGRVTLASVPFGTEAECATETGDAGFARRLFRRGEVELVEVRA